MIKTIQELQEIDKILRNVIIQQSELQADRVLNALSIRGTDLEKQIQTDEYISIDLNNSMILFEVYSRNSENNMTMEEDDENNSLTSYCSFMIKLIIYGNTSKMLAQKLKARFESQYIRNKLYDSGIHVDNVSEIETISEFINSTIWLRNDLSILFSCKLSVSQLQDDEELKIKNDIIIN